jgi:hypothetical protein
VQLEKLVMGLFQKIESLTLKNGVYDHVVKLGNSDFVSSITSLLWSEILWFYFS